MFITLAKRKGQKFTLRDAKKCRGTQKLWSFMKNGDLDCRFALRFCFFILLPRSFSKYRCCLTFSCCFLLCFVHRIQILSRYLHISTSKWLIECSYTRRIYIKLIKHKKCAHPFLQTVKKIIRDTYLKWKKARINVMLFVGFFGFLDSCAKLVELLIGSRREKSLRPYFWQLKQQKSIERRTDTKAWSRKVWSFLDHFWWSLLRRDRRKRTERFI